MEPGIVGLLGLALVVGGAFLGARSLWRDVRREGIKAPNANAIEPWEEALVKYSAEASAPVAKRWSREFRRGAIIRRIIAALLLGSVGAETQFATYRPIFSFVFSAVAAALLLWDAEMGRERSTWAALAYFNSVRRGRWQDAFCCLSPAAHRDAAIPVIPELRCVGGTADLRSPEGVKQYWSAFTTPGNGLDRYITAVEASVDDGASPSVHRLNVTLRIAYYPTRSPVMSLLRKHEYVIKFTVVAHRWHSQWWIVTGGVQSGSERRADFVRPANSSVAGRA